MRECVLLLAGLAFASLAEAQTISGAKSFQHSIEVMTTTRAVYTLAGNPAPNRRDFVGRYLPGTIDWRGYLDWAYMNDARSVAGMPAKPMAGGTVTFAIAKPGTYEIRWYSLTDQSVAKLLRTEVIEAELTKFEFLGPQMKVIHTASNDPDHITVEILGQTGVIVAPKDTVVTVTPTPAPGVNPAGP